MTSLRATYSASRSIHSLIGAGDRFTPTWLHAAMTDSGFIVTAVFCAIGLLVTLNLIFRFPGVQPGMEQLAQFLG